MDRFQNRNEQQWSILRSLEAGVSLLFRDFFIPQILETNLPPPPFPPIKKKIHLPKKVLHTSCSTSG